jgi:hypothetical protein
MATRVLAFNMSVQLVGLREFSNIPRTPPAEKGKLQECVNETLAAFPSGERPTVLAAEDDGFHAAWLNLLP